MNVTQLERKLIAAARANPPSDRVPYAFEKRIMAHLAAQPVVDDWALWARALLRAAAPCVVAKSVHDAGWPAFVHMLEYKARLNGREFHRIGRFVPTSQTCSACGVKDGPKPLHVRTWQC